RVDKRVNLVIASKHIFFGRIQDSPGRLDNYRTDSGRRWTRRRAGTGASGNRKIHVGKVGLTFFGKKIVVENVVESVLIEIDGVAHILAALIDQGASAEGLLRKVE